MTDIEDVNDSLLEDTEVLRTDTGRGRLEGTTVEFEDELLVIDSEDWRHSSLLRYQILGGYFVFILFGLAEQTIGTLIPKFQDSYKINDIQTSCIFLASVTGYFIMAFMSEHSHTYLGVRGVVVLGLACMTSCFLIISIKPPFFIVVLSYVLNGIGFGSIDASLGSWMGNLVDSNEIMGILHGCYGIGCMISPPLITFLIERRHDPWPWNHYYLVLASVGSSCLIWVIIAYRHETPKKYRYTAIIKHEKEAQAATEAYELEAMNQNEGGSSSSDSHDSVNKNSISPEININESADAGISKSSFNREEARVTTGEILRSPLVWAMALILFAYVGTEVAFGSWVISYLTRIKGFSYKNSSYLASAFWTGLTAGRICLGFATSRLFKDELSANFTYLALSFIGYFSFWLLSLTSIGFILFPVAFVTGVFVGPIFPTTVVCSIKILPARFHTGAVGFICAFGGGGGAVIPFAMGLVAHSSLGLELFPVIIALLSSIVVAMWLLLMKKIGSNYSANKL